jgi:hypothetical protein
MEGVCRSVSVALAYVLSHHGVSLKTSYDALKRVRGIDVNPSFRIQLAMHEIELYGASSVRRHRVRAEAQERRVQGWVQCRARVGQAGLGWLRLRLRLRLRAAGCLRLPS